MSTPHNEASIGDIAKIVLMPGDPLRAKYIAEHYLDNIKQFNTVRGMLGYTGYYKGKRISVMGSGMGIPSISIYAYELYNFYDVETIIRVGSCGAIQENINIKDIIIAQGACTDSSFIHQYQLPGTYSALSDYDLLEKAVHYCRQHDITYHVGNLISSDLFYNELESYKDWGKMNVLGVEMEAYALLTLANRHHKKALAICTVSDSLITHIETTSKEREQSFTQMMELALEINI